MDELILHYPYLHKIYDNENIYHGMYVQNNNSYKIKINAPNFPKMTKCTSVVYNGLEEISLQCSTQIDENLTISNFMTSLQDELNTISKSNNDNTSLGILRAKEMLKQLQQIQIRDDHKFNIDMSAEFDEVHIKMIRCYKNHFLNLAIDDSMRVYVKDHSLPQPLNTNLFNEFGTIDTHLNTFLKYLEQLDEFYCNMNRLDDLCFVVHPININTRSRSRTFKIDDNNIYVKITVDPFSPSSIVTQIIGPSYTIDEMREKYNERRLNWDMDLDIYQNLLRIFDKTYFPLRTESTEMNEEHLQNCGICYMYRVENEIPYVSCDNPKCDLIYHISCLKKWFSTLTNSTTFFSVTMGYCPYCKEKLSASFDNVLENE